MVNNFVPVQKRFSFFFFLLMCTADVLLLSFSLSLHLNYL